MSEQVKSTRLPDAKHIWLVGSKSPLTRRLCCLLPVLCALNSLQGCASPPYLKPASEHMPVPTWMEQAKPAMTVQEAQKANIEFEDLGVWNSRLGESQASFVERVGSFLNQYAKHTNFEACGYVVSENSLKEDIHASSTDASSFGPWSIHVTSNHSHFNCLSLDFTLDHRLTARTPTLHVHPHPSSDIHVSREDVSLNPGLGVPVGTPLNIEDQGFSKHDYHLGPGYVVIRGHVFEQQGPGTEHYVGVVNEGVVNDEASSNLAQQSSMSSPISGSGISMSSSDRLSR